MIFLMLKLDSTLVLAKSPSSSFVGKEWQRSQEARSVRSIIHRPTNTTELFIFSCQMRVKKCLTSKWVRMISNLRSELLKWASQESNLPKASQLKRLLFQSQWTKTKSGNPKLLLLTLFQTQPLVSLIKVMTTPKL